MSESYRIRKISCKPLSAKIVFDLLSKIPEGKVVTYGDIAKAAGSPKGARGVGKILNINPNPVVVPCHRVVKSDGQIGGYAYGIGRKMKLLQNEGLTFKDGKVVGFDKVRAVVS